MMERTKPRILVLVAIVAVLGTLSVPGVGRAGAQDATPATTPVDIMPATPVGDQLGWVLAQLNGEAAALTEADLTTRFAPAFLANFLSAPALLDLLRQTAAEYAPVTLMGFAYPPTATGAIALVEIGGGQRGALVLTVAPDAPYRITRMELTEPPAAATETGRRVDIGERALYLDCTGTGGPTVVLEGGISSDWAAVQPAVAAHTRVCSYDRPDSPGSRSDPTLVRTAQQVVDDLRALLAAAGEPGPYVLVGHSMGGLYVQLYAYQHPDEVAGLVLVDPTPEEFAARLGQLAATLGTPVPPASPPTQPSPDEASFIQMRAARTAGPLPPMPLVVLSHGRTADPAERPPGWPVADEEQIWQSLHEDIARLVPNGRHIVAEDSGHDVHTEQPDRVVEAILDVVAAVRNPGVWGTPVAATRVP